MWMHYVYDNNEEIIAAMCLERGFCVLLKLVNTLKYGGAVYWRDRIGDGRECRRVRVGLIPDQPPPIPLQPLHG